MAEDASNRPADIAIAAAVAAAMGILAGIASTMPAIDAGLLGRAAEQFRPRERVRPSAWVEKHVRLESDQTERPGPFSCDYLPFTRAMHDLLWEHPEKRGEIWIKPAQIGATRAMINKLLCKAGTDPGRMAYIAENDEKVRKFVTREFMPGLRTVENGRLALAVEREVDAGRRQMMLTVPLPGGEIDFATAASESSVTGTAYRDVFVDEYEMSSEAMPASSGDLWTSAKQRTKRYRTGGTVSAFGHPRLHNQGLHLLWITESTCHSWGFECPHAGCLKFIAPRVQHIRYRLTRSDDGKPDPETAWFACPHCGQEIADRDRARALWPAGSRPGATGRVRSELSEEECRRRQWIGLWISALCDPNISVRELAKNRDLAEKSGKERAILDWWNKEAGEPFKASAASDLTVETLEKCVLADHLPALPEDIEFVAAGVDVQAPRDSPTLYVGFYAFGRSGKVYCVGLYRVAGVGSWAAYLELIQTVRWRTADGRTLGVLADAIDKRYEGGQVLDNLRQQAHNGAGRAIHRMAVAYEPTMKSEPWMRFAPDRAREKPGRPDLGLIDYRYLHRHSVVDRAIKLIQGGRFHVALPPNQRLPDDWLSQMTAFALRPKKSTHGFDQGVLEWEKPDDYRDDWLQTLCYAIVAAVAHGELETLHLRGRTPPGFVIPDWEVGGGGFGGPTFD